MVDPNLMNKVMGDEHPYINTADTIDQRIEENIQKREIVKLRTAFYQNLKDHYRQRKYKEQITLQCSDRCLTSFREDDLTRGEMSCMVNCFGKSYRYLAFSNTLYTYLVSGSPGQIDDHIRDNYEDSIMSIGEEEQPPMQEPPKMPPMAIKNVQ